MNKYIKKIVFNPNYYCFFILFLLSLVFFNTGGVLKRITGIIFFSGYIFFTGYIFFERFISKIIEIKMWIGSLLGMFISLSLLGLITSIFLYSVGFHNWALILIFVIHFLGILFLFRFPRKRIDFFKKYLQNEKSDFFNLKKDYTFLCLIVLYFLLVGIGFYLLADSETQEVIQSPWQTIVPTFIYIFFIATVLLGLLFYYKKIPISFVIFLAIVHSLLLHSFLPLSHELIYGADQWRHGANEARFLQGEGFLKPVLSSDTHLSFIERFDFGLVSYGQLWSLIVLFASFFGNTILFLNRWFIAILWSIIFPILLYFLATSIGWSEKKIKFLILSSFLPFTWIAGGSLTLPNSLGFLWWLILLSLLILRIKNPLSKKFLYMVVAGFVTALFSYSLYALLFGGMWFLVEVILKTENSFSLYKKNIARFVAANLVAFSIPLLEIVAAFSRFNLQHSWAQEFKQLLGNFFAIYLAFGPRPHDIDRGNIIFNQTPLAAFVPNLFSISRIWLVFFMLIFFLLIGIGIMRALKNKSLINSFLAWGALSITFMYSIARYALEGSQVLSRRLEHIVAFFWIIFFVQGTSYIYNLLFIHSVRFRRFIAILGIFFLGCAIAASYSLGPDVRTVSTSEYEAVKYIWQSEKKEVSHCVIADTYPLLALEFISEKKIIGGGFPIDQNFAQAELEKLFLEMQKNSNEELWNKALEIAKTKRCWLIVTKANFKNTSYSLGYQKDFISFGNVLIWRYNRQ